MLNKYFLIIFNFLLSVFDFPNKNKIKNFFKKNLLNEKLTIIDIGAHKGETINFFLSNFNVYKIYAFEPNEKLYKLLLNKKRYISNKVELLNCGVGEEEKIIPLNITIDSASSTFNEIDINSKYYKKKNMILSMFSKNKTLFDKNQSAKIIKLSSFLDQKNLMKIDILKIDTEGFEFKILKGINTVDFKKIRFIYFEHHYDNMIKKNYKFSDMRSFLEKNNFKQMYKLRMRFRKSFEYIYEKKE